MKRKNGGNETERAKGGKRRKVLIRVLSIKELNATIRQVDKTVISALEVNWKWMLRSSGL